jgi:uncharacterized phage protein gp47/JayE
MTWRDLENFTFEYLMEQALALVPNTIDKREGSIIYDALAPAMYQLAEFYLNLRTISMNSFVAFATGEDLDERALLQGITRYPATKTRISATFTNFMGEPLDVPISAQFSSANIQPEILYTVIEKVELGEFILEAQEAGGYANSYTGELLPITNVPNLGMGQVKEITFFGSDEETDDNFRQRVIDVVSEKPFGGNITDYDQKVRAIEGVGEVQVYPTWNGGGTVKLSIVGNDYQPVSSEKVAEVQGIIDPTDGHGQGLGIAPIGHSVTVVTPTSVPINISATVSLRPEFSLSQITPEIESRVEEYIHELQVAWGQPVTGNIHSLTMFVSRISSIIIGIDGVVNVADVQINGSADDLVLTQNETTQELPVMGTVTIS